jgi:hypothetical protein
MDLERQGDSVAIKVRVRMLSNWLRCRVQAYFVHKIKERGTQKKERYCTERTPLTGEPYLASWHRCIQSPT